MPPFISVRHLHMHAIAPRSSMSWMNSFVFKTNSAWFKVVSRAERLTTYRLPKFCKTFFFFCLSRIKKKTFQYLPVIWKTEAYKMSRRAFQYNKKYETFPILPSRFLVFVVDAFPLTFYKRWRLLKVKVFSNYFFHFHFRLMMLGNIYKINQSIYKKQHVNISNKVFLL